MSSHTTDGFGPQGLGLDLSGGYYDAGGGWGVQMTFTGQQQVAGQQHMTVHTAAAPVDTRHADPDVCRQTCCMV
jgi:hypothetical protein